MGSRPLSERQAQAHPPARLPGLRGCGGCLVRFLAAPRGTLETLLGDGAIRGTGAGSGAEAAAL